jgi:hypothetical protein
MDQLASITNEKNVQDKALQCHVCHTVFVLGWQKIQQATHGMASLITIPP